MHLEDFPMDAHACPLKFGSCKSFHLFLFRYDWIIKQRAELSSILKRRGNSSVHEECSVSSVLLGNDEGGMSSF